MLQPRETSSVNSDQFDRAGWWLGIIAPILILVGFFAVDEGGTELSGSTTEIVEHLDALHGRIVIGSMIGILGAFALLGFVASLRLHLSKTGARGEWLGLVAFGSGMIMAAGAIVQGSFRLEIDAIVDSGMPTRRNAPDLGTRHRDRHSRLGKRRTCRHDVHQRLHEWAPSQTLGRCWSPARCSHHRSHADRSRRRQPHPPVVAEHR